jgi:hypothetical protein
VKIVEKFGKAVSELLDSRELSTRAVMYKTGVDYSTIQRMGNGIIPKNGVIIDFARGMGEPIKTIRQAQIFSGT